MSNHRKTSSTIPSPEDFFLKTALYESFEITSENHSDVISIEQFYKNIDCYCVECQKESTFQSEQGYKIGKNEIGITREIRNYGLYCPREDIEGIIRKSRLTPEKREKEKEKEITDTQRDRLFGIEFTCSRNLSHYLFYLFQVQKKKITKVGQFPSLADLQNFKIKKYKKMLEEKYHREFKRAIGLHAHGIGIGSFVYLRRIFENLIEDAHQIAAKKISDWNKDDYKNSKMNEKILILKDFLPPFLVENKKIYSILSKGIHELDEKECLSYFDIIKNGIELILDEKLEQEIKHQKIEKTKKAIDQVEK